MNAGGDFAFEFTVKQTETTSDGGGWRRFSVTLTEANVGFLFIYNENDTTAAVGTVRVVSQDELNGDDAQIDLPEFCNTLAQLQAGVKFRVEKTGTAITLYAAGADGSYVQIAETACGADDAGKISFRGSYDTWQFSGFTLTREEA